MRTDEQRAKDRDRQRRYRAADPEKYRAYMRDYFAKHPEKRQRSPGPGRPSGPNHANWKGDRVGYFGVHAWMVRHFGRPSRCDHCGTTTAKQFHWANVDHTYRRVREEWMRLCISCHLRHDYAHGLRRKRGKAQ